MLKYFKLNSENKKVNYEDKFDNLYDHIILYISKTIILILFLLSLKILHFK